MTVYGHDGRVIEPFTAERAQEEAQGASAGWVAGWTEVHPDRDEPQRKIVYSGDGSDDKGDYYDITVQGAQYSNEPDRRFRIRVTAEEIPVPMMDAPSPVPDHYRAGERCPDNGSCGHFCSQGYCFRVACCSPLSMYGDRWPDSIVARYSRDHQGAPADG